MTVLGRGRLPRHDGEDSAPEPFDARAFLRVAYAWKAQGWPAFFGWILSGPSRWRLGIEAALAPSQSYRVRRRAATLLIALGLELAADEPELSPEDAADLRAWMDGLDALPHASRRAAAWRDAGRPRRRRRRG